MKLTIGIKAYNEERHIAHALESAVVAAAQFDGEVVLADSGSTDRTIQIAQKYPIKIVQFANPSDRCCGAGAQLAFQESAGEFFYMLDGDMVLSADFIGAAISFLEMNPLVAGVGGRVREMHTQAEEFQIRANSVQKGKDWLPGFVQRLDCGGLYRASAIKQVGYFADRNLHAFEEFDLAARLCAAGWQLARIDIPAVDHYGHLIDGYSLILKRLNSGYSGASGEVLRGSLGRSHFWIVVSRLAHIRYAAVVLCWWAAIISGLFIAWFSQSKKIEIGILLLLTVLLPIFYLIARRRSFKLGVYSFVSWNASAFGFVAGFFRRRVPVEAPIKSVQLKVCDKMISHDLGR